MPDGTRDAALAAARRSGQSLGEWLDDAVAARSAVARPSAADLIPEMEAIAAQLARLSQPVGAEQTHGRRHPAPVAGDPDPRAALRDAVVEIARRQADLDRNGEAAAAAQPTPDASMPVQSPSAAPRPVPSSPRPASAAVAREAEAFTTSMARRRDPAGLRRAGADLSAEVSQTFARFSRDLHDAILTTDARPKVEALDRQMRQIGQAVEGLGAGLPADALLRIGEQTREMRDLLRASSARSVPLDAMERQVSSLEARLGRLAVLPVASTAPPDFADTMAEVRAMLEGFPSGVSMAGLESRLDDMTARIERGLDAQGPAGLIEGLSRRVDEIHASLRAQMAETAVDTRPLEGLVRGLSDRLGQAREASADFEQLETAMREVAAKIDAAAGADPHGAQAIEVQLARLTERLDRSEASLKALDGVEHSLGELFSQFEVTRQVAIDAAETAARTAARDTLRAALQNPGLAPRGPDVAPAFAEQVARGLDDLRAMQDSAERRTQTTLSDLRFMMERLAQGMAVPGPSARVPAAPEEPRRRRPGAEPAAPESARAAADPIDLLIEPGFGRGASSAPVRAEAPGSPESDIDAAMAGPAEADGPASFIAAARRAAQAAQASAASTAALKGVERRPPPGAASRRRPGADPGPVDGGPMLRAKSFLARRRRPILLGIAALVLLVGALEVVKLGVEPVTTARLGAAEIVAPARSRSAALDGDATPAARPASVPAAVLPPLAAPAPPPLPTFVAGPAKAPAPADGIAESLRSLAASGDPAAQYDVGLRYAEGRGVPRDPKQAVAWFDKAASQGSAPAQYRLGSAYEKGAGTDRDPALAMAWYGKAADAGNIRAMHNLAVMAAEGAAGKPDYAKAALWFGKASSYGVRDSQFNLAILYARGLGIEQSLSESYRWFAIAASEGDDDAAKKRDEVAAKLDPGALAAAKAAADAYHPATPLAAANEAASSQGAGDAGAARSSAAAPAPPASKVSQL